MNGSDDEDSVRSRYMLDTNAFDYILDRAVDPKSVRRLGEICITTVQHGELLDVPDPRRRERLLRVLSAIDPTVRPATVGVRADEPRRDGRAVREDGASGIARQLYGSARKPKRWRDATIGEAASLEGCVLVTDDDAFRRRAAEIGVPTLSCAEAFADLGPPPSASDA